ncbi:hypothetical protein ACFUPZ_17480 [Microbacterium oxydans]|uniref:hypothetical protein n=1 Tax=Microbacterium oxydans TaxID=82380 RepID=UPI003636DA54
MAKLGSEANYRRAATSEWTTEMLKRRRELIVAIAATLALTATMASPAHASDGDVDDADSVAATIEAATPTTTLSEPGVVKGGQLSTTVGEISAAVPLLAEENVVVSVPIDGGTQTESRAIELPDEIPISDGVVAEDGTVVFTADDRSGDAVAVQTLADGSTRIQTVLGGAESPHEFGYRMDGYQPYQSDTGEVIFLGKSGDYVPVAAPWATDANGAAVETRYEVRGDELFQVVTPSATTAYPVVADPSWIWNGPIWGMKLTRAETSRVRDYTAAVGMCGFFAKALPRVFQACAVFGSYIVAQAHIAQGDNPKTCLFFTAAPVPGVIMRVTC